MAAQYLQVDRSELQRILRQKIPLVGNVLRNGCGCGNDTVFMANLTAKIKDTIASKKPPDLILILEFFNSREFSFGLY